MAWLYIYFCQIRGGWGQGADGVFIHHWLQHITMSVERDLAASSNDKHIPTYDIPPQQSLNIYSKALKYIYKQIFIDKIHRKIYL